MAHFEVEKVTQDLEKLDFHHPYTPYDVQEQFMKAVYDVLETGNGQVGILESPTGTVSAWKSQGRYFDAVLIGFGSAIRYPIRDTNTE